jgi:hypothetical protein
MMLICVVSLGLSLCAGVSASAADEPAFTVDSPFDLTLGSTNYAVRLGKSVRSNTSASYDPETKVTTTNWSAYGSVRLSAPYHGVKSVSLDFKGEERRLDSFRFDIGEKKLRGGGTLTVDECRKVMKEIADDISKRFGVKMEADKSDGELSDEEIDNRIEQMTKGDSGKRRTVYTSFSHIHGSGEREGVRVRYSISGMVGRKRMCSVSVSVYTSFIQHAKEPVSVASSSIAGLVSQEEQVKAHAEAKRLREALGKLFGIDFDATEEKKGQKGDSPEWPPKNEWTPMEHPVAGLVECKPNSGMTSFFRVPIVNFVARRAYPGDVEEAELQRLAKDVLGCLETAYGERIPVADTAESRAQLAEVLGAGVPTFGDSRALIGLDKVQTFVGKLGDLAIDISYALPRYERRGEDYRLVRRGAVVLTILQSPMITPGKMLPSK